MQKVVTNITREKLNPQETPSIIHSVTNVQSSVKIPNMTSTKIDTSVKIDIVEKKAEEKGTITRQQIEHIDSSIPTTQEQGVSQAIMIDQGKYKEIEPKVKKISGHSSFGSLTNI